MRVLASQMTRLFWYKGWCILLPYTHITHCNLAFTVPSVPLPIFCELSHFNNPHPGELSTFSFIIFVLDRVGRKKPLMFGAAGLVVLFAILGAIVATNPPLPADAPAGMTVNTTAQRLVLLVFWSSTTHELDQTHY